ncbi:MAG: AtpZ/AtpI family protein [Pseudoprimorskyibacter sp.]|jgi:ATP synthase protein I|nr:AtpZ/AtpI family protein [Pseudoprimorskyibacter sp.]
MPEPDRLKTLSDKIAAAKAQDKGLPTPGEHIGHAHMAWRMVTELAAGIGIGFGIGYGLDTLLGTVPWLMLVFTLLGLAAGIKVMIRTANEVQSKAMAAEQAVKDERDDDGN